ncbi:MARCKS-related protein [Eudromia elegans]
MGSQGSKAARGDGGVEPAKANGQENGHVRLNGDMTPKAAVEAAPPKGSGAAEPPAPERAGEGGAGGGIEAAAAEAQADGAAAPGDAPRKKKRFSFKKSFKLSGISFRKSRRELGDSCAASPGEEQGPDPPAAAPAQEQGGSGGAAGGQPEPQGQEQEREGSNLKPFVLCLRRMFHLVNRVNEKSGLGSARSGL